MKKRKRVLIIVPIVFIFILLLLSCKKSETPTEETLFSDIENISHETQNKTRNKHKNEIPAKEEKELTLGSSFVFDELEITIGNSYTFTTLEDKFSDKNGSIIIKLPVTIKNLSSNTKNLNRFYYNFFGSKGLKLESVSNYFAEDNDIVSSVDMRSGASQEVYIHMLYDGDGDYYINFDNYNENREKFEIKIPVVKNKIESDTVFYSETT